MKKEIILDLGSGTQTGNDPKLILKMIQTISALQKTTNKRLMIKFQLFEKIDKLIALDRKIFDYSFQLCKVYNIPVLASVFDLPSLQYYLSYDTPYIKVACQDHLYDLIESIPKKKIVYVSIDDVNKRNKLIDRYPFHDLIFLHAIRKYPALENEYRALFYGNLSSGISDHTIGLELYKRYQPLYWEKHFVLDRENNPDPFGSDFCTIPEELKEIL